MPCSHADIKDIVTFANARGIMVIPEVPTLLNIFWIANLGYFETLVKFDCKLPSELLSGSWFLIIMCNQI